MPATDALQPPLTPTERDVVKSYGGWTPFMHAYALKPYDHDHIDEAHQIARTFAAADTDVGAASNNGDQSSGDSSAR
ncbi:hypothetical protein Micbo1qcDRAFT_237388 [Microdochium bolleyi]|uniref:Uncharacterized protein n=1 Tax=Microdochium bolleyi TaxID=196109 RepID=A0A136IL19_9PEZI|nr:hypothetical protein Micbo1qcDRAFT_237388 [Microdochium bolleyi]